MKRLKKLLARWYGCPYSIKQFWAAGHQYFGDSMTNPFPGSKILKRESWSVGTYISLFYKDGYYYCYKVVGRSRASGNDHIISPLMYDVEFYKRIKK